MAHVGLKLLSLLSQAPIKVRLQTCGTGPDAVHISGKVDIPVHEMFLYILQTYIHWAVMSGLSVDTIDKSKEAHFLM